MRVYLTGFMGSGKSRVGRDLAGLLAVPFVDLDREVEREAGTRVAEIFATRGEAAFRRLERAALLATEALPAAVVATGGGVAASPENAADLARLGATVFLDVPFEVLLARLGPASRAARPLFGDPEAARRLYDTRLPAYRAADLVVAISGGATAREVAATIAALLREKPCAT